jgi:hypothetical protein
VKSYSVRACSLDAIVSSSGISRVDVLKIDVEGAELLVLKGAQETLARFRPYLLVELDDDLLKPMQTSSSEVISFLQGLGYAAGARYDGANFEFHPSQPITGSVVIPGPLQISMENT